jgi:hypothetical protein
MGKIRRDFNIEHEKDKMGFFMVTWQYIVIYGFDSP